MIPNIIQQQQQHQQRARAANGATSSMPRNALLGDQRHNGHGGEAHAAGHVNGHAGQVHTDTPLLHGTIERRLQAIQAYTDRQSYAEQQVASLAYQRQQNAATIEQLQKDKADLEKYAARLEKDKAEQEDLRKKSEDAARELEARVSELSNGNKLLHYEVEGNKELLTVQQELLSVSDIGRANLIDEVKDLKTQAERERGLYDDRGTHNEELTKILRRKNARIAVLEADVASLTGKLS